MIYVVQTPLVPAIIITKNFLSFFFPTTPAEPLLVAELDW